MLRDLQLEALQEAELAIRSLAHVLVRAPLWSQCMAGHCGRWKPTPSVHGPYDVTWAWSAALHYHPDAPDGIRYRARHDDAGFSTALFERARARVVHRDSVGLLDPGHARQLVRWLDRYGTGLTT